MWCIPVRLIAIVEAILVAAAMLAAGTARADVASPPPVSQFSPLRPPPSLGDPMAEADELQRQIADLDGAWDSLTPQQRNERIKRLQDLVTKVDFDSRNLPQDQKAQVDAILLPSLGHLVVLVGKAQGPGQPCYFPACLPGL